MNIYWMNWANGLKINFSLTKVMLMELFLITKVILIRQRAESCDGQVVKALDSKPHGVSPDRFKSCSQHLSVLSSCSSHRRVGLPRGSDGKESTCNAWDQGSTPGSGRSPGGGHGNILQYSCLENPHGQRSLAGYSPWAAKSQIQPSDKAQHSTWIIKHYSLICFKISVKLWSWFI